MPRFARKHQLAENLIFHIFNRSNGKKPIFEEKEDFAYFLQLLTKYQQRYTAKIYHWVIMNNHYHLLLEMETPELISKMMGGLAKSYTNYYHQKNNTSGYLWEGRYKMQAVEKELYLLTCGRYIERNPVRATLVSKAEFYEFSSAQAYCLGKKDSIITESVLYKNFGDDQESRQKAYSQFLENFDHEQDISFSKMDDPVGTRHFKNRLIYQNGRYMPRRQGRSKG